MLGLSLLRAILSISSMYTMPRWARLDVVVGILQQADDDVLDVFADVAGLGQVRGIGDGERHVEDACEGLRQQRLARSGGTEQQDVGLLQLDFVGTAAALESLVVVVNRDGEDLLRALLTDDVFVEDGLDLSPVWGWRCCRALPLPSPSPQR